jgi:hypothetical protein
MGTFVNPAPVALMARVGAGLRFAEVLIRRSGGGFDLCHIADAEAPPAQLEPVAAEQLGVLAQTAAGGAFRPNKAAPNLRSGWRSTVRNAEELGSAMEALYPGALADWFAVQGKEAPVTSFREFTQRQTGIYRITQTLTDAQAAAAIDAGCHARFCLRQRLWTVGGLDVDAPGAKSVIPCLEPCALLLEFARSAARREQEDKVVVELALSDAASLVAALDLGLTRPDPTVREGDSGHPANPRRMQWLRNRLVIQARTENSSKQD